MAIKACPNECDWTDCDKDAPITASLTRDGKMYAIDLCEEHAGALTTAGREVKAPTTTATESKGSRAKAKEGDARSKYKGVSWNLARDWAKDVLHLEAKNPSGNPGKDILDAYINAGQPSTWEKTELSAMDAKALDKVRKATPRKVPAKKAG